MNCKKVKLVVCLSISMIYSKPFYDFEKYEYLAMQSLKNGFKMMLDRCPDSDIKKLAVENSASYITSSSFKQRFSELAQKYPQSELDSLDDTITNEILPKSFSDEQCIEIGAKIIGFNDSTTKEFYNNTPYFLALSEQRLTAIANKESNQFVFSKDGTIGFNLPISFKYEKDLISDENGDLEFYSETDSAQLYEYYYPDTDFDDFSIIKAEHMLGALVEENTKDLVRKKIMPQEPEIAVSSYNPNIATVRYFYEKTHTGGEGMIAIKLNHSIRVIYVGAYDFKKRDAIMELIEKTIKTSNDTL